MGWQQAWYPVAYLRDLDPQRPTPFTLLEHDLVLWFDAASQRSRAEGFRPRRAMMRAAG